MKTVLITGASRGIGAEMAAVFCHAGYQVAINYNQSEKQAHELTKKLTASGGQAISVQADIADEAQVKAMINTVTAEFGSIDILINNAGIANQQLFTDTTAEQWHRMMAVHVDGMFHCTQAVLPAMIAKKQGVVLNISSMWGVVGASCEVAYSTAKAAMIGFTKSLAREVGPCNIRVNCIAPGVIQTEMNQNLSPETLDSLCEEVPLCRLGTANEVAKTALFLAEDTASYITGQVLVVDGGMI